MVKPTEFPNEGELVVGTVKEVQNYGAIVALDEYGNKQAFVHIAEVSSGWVKRIRDYVRENQRTVFKVLGVDPNRGAIDLSLKRANEHQRREKIQEWKNEQKAEKLFEMVAAKTKKSPEQCYKDFGFALMEKYGTLYSAFEEAAFDPETLKNDGFKGAWIGHLAEVAKDAIVIPFVELKGYLEATSPAPDGVEHVKRALAEAGKSEFEDVTITVKYIGAPHYLMRVRAPDFKIAEEQLEKAVARAGKAMKDGVVGFRKELEAKK